MPKVSVVMPVFNGEQFVEEAAQSILAQTYTDFDFIIIDDGSTDRTLDILSRIRDSRIRLVTHRQNQGLIDSLNEGFRLSTGEYVARMDCDDVAHPSRLFKQVHFLDKNDNIGVVGSSAKLFGEKIGEVRVPVNHDQIKISALFNSPMIHPTVVIRTSILEQPVFDRRYPYAEDYELWTRLLTSGVRFHNLEDYLLSYRVHREQVSSANTLKQSATADNVRRLWLDLLGIQADEKIIRTHALISDGILDSEDFDIVRACDHLESLLFANEKQAVFNRQLLFDELARRYMTAVLHRPLATGLKLRRALRPRLFSFMILGRRLMKFSQRRQKRPYFGAGVKNG